MDKIILILYYQESLSSDEYDHLFKYMEKVRKNDKILIYAIPTKTDIRIDCINPKLVSEDDYKIVKEKLETINSDLDRLLVNFKNSE